MTTSPTSSSNSELDALVASNLSEIRSRIADTGRDVHSVRVVAVTKTFGPEAIVAAVANGLTHVGENYVSELIEKHESLRDIEVQWEFLGAIQTNKVSKIANYADVVTTLSRASEVESFAKRGATNRFYLQVDFTGNDGRNGAPERDIPKLCTLARESGLLVSGLMTIASPNPREAELAFRSMAALADELQLPDRSMGMTDDFEAACRAGSTELRLGRALFGARKS